MGLGAIVMADDSQINYASNCIDCVVSKKCRQCSVIPYATPPIPTCRWSRKIIDRRRAMPERTHDPRAEFAIGWAWIDEGQEHCRGTEPFRQNQDRRVFFQSIQPE